MKLEVGIQRGSGGESMGGSLDEAAGTNGLAEAIRRAKCCLEAGELASFLTRHKEGGGFIVQSLVNGILKSLKEWPGGDCLLSENVIPTLEISERFEPAHTARGRQSIYGVKVKPVNPKNLK